MQTPEYRLKEKFSVRRLEIFDREDSDGDWNATVCSMVFTNSLLTSVEGKFGVDVADAQKRLTLLCKTQAEKNDWMAALVVLHIRRFVWTAVEEVCICIHMSERVWVIVQYLN